MYEDFGAVVSGSSVEFSVFFPDNTIDPNQYAHGGLPHIRKLKVTGDFQQQAGGVNWDYENAPELTQQQHLNGWLYTYQLNNINDGFYEYKYFVEFEDGTTRWCSDPCTKYGGSEFENSGFVVGGNYAMVRPIANRLPLKDLVIYEMMLDDFTDEYRSGRAPLDAVRDKLDYLQSLGVNAIEFMPWTAWSGSEFSWGYDPISFFSVEYRYYHDPSEPLKKLYRLKVLINELHDRNIHVIMDGVFNHANAGITPSKGFPYYWLYQDPKDSPYIGNFVSGGFFEEFDFANNCTEEFVVDVCKYWINEYCIDGIRFDYAKGFYKPDDKTQGISEVIRYLQQFTLAKGLQNMTFTLELLPDNRYEAIEMTNNIGADGCWYDPLMWHSFDAGRTGNIDTSLIRAFNAGKGFAAEKRPVTYIENHDHSTLTEQSGGRMLWWRTQPMAIALFTVCGAPLIHNGQEFGEQYWFPEEGEGRAMKRPLRWERSTDGIGSNLFQLYQKLIAIRKTYSALRSLNFYPDAYDMQLKKFNDHGYGINEDQDVIIYHRWDNNEQGQLERFIIVINFSSFDQRINIPFPDNGNWNELLNGTSAIIQNYWLYEQTIYSHWGRVYCKVG